MGNDMQYSLITLARLLTYFLWVSTASLFLHAGVVAQETTNLETQLDQYLLGYSQGTATLADLDAIYRQMNSNTPIQTRTRAFGYRVMAMSPTEIDEQTLNAAIALAEEANKSGVTAAITEMKALLVNLYFNQGDTRAALVELELLGRLLPDVSSPRVRFLSHQAAGQLLGSVGDYEQALSHYLQAAEAVNETDNMLTLRRRMLVTEGIARVHTGMRQYERSLESTINLIEIAEAAGLEKEYARLYLFKGYLQSILLQLEAAIASFETSIEWAKQFDDQETILLNMNNIGSTLMELERYEEARDILSAALSEAERVNDTLTSRLLHFNLLYIDVMQGTLESVPALEQAAEQVRHVISESEYIDLLQYMAKAYEHAGLYEKTIDVLKTQRELQQEFSRKERNKAIQELQLRAQANEQAIEIELLEQRNLAQQSKLRNADLQKKVFYLLSLVIVLASLLLLLAWRAARRANIRLQSLNQELEYQSSHDPLTGLLNRRSFQAAMTNKQRLSDSSNKDKHPDALILLDVDYFKKVNDRKGHAAGDKVLVELAQRLRSLSRNTDMVVRWGGEEFLIYLKEMDPSFLPTYVEKLLKTIGETPVEAAGKTISVTATAGFISFPFESGVETIHDWERCLQIADMALYLGKVQGRNQALGVMELLEENKAGLEALEHNLSGAIEKGWVRTTHVPGPA
ncbi:hypothetical protein CWE15_10480 [Aliidiomarina taiwanensis]|uniref:diguanylate cyclase n=1 Tax=Aliidiomarina taiwanensis TaxID=946228 RepID=A0A432WYT1_9GAMM|nr:GGDEF domain-containing protein [Aliidiomarina taiwanensis]RUO38919.1 hypothetical protein CWE15_10480 [Aliidiomarina taiwanensis]